MSALDGRRYLYLDRQLLVGSAVLLLFWVSRALTFESAGVDTSAPLPKQFYTLANSTFAALVFSPTFILSNARAMRTLSNPMWLVRLNRRSDLITLAISSLAARSLFFSFFVSLPSLLIVCCASRVSLSLASCAFLLLIAIMLQTLYFMTIGFIYLFIYFFTNKSSVALAFSALYASFDFLLSFTKLYDSSVFYMGWNLITLDELSMFPATLISSLRLLVILLLLILGCRKTVCTFDVHEWED